MAPRCAATNATIFGPPHKKIRLDTDVTAQRPLFSATGRPLRQAAARKSTSYPGFADSGIAISDSEEDGVDDDDTDDSSSEESDTDSALNAALKSQKQKRSPSPKLLPDHLLGWHDVRDQSPSESDAPSTPAPSDAQTGTVSFTFNIPPGFHGPLTVNFDARELLRVHDTVGRPIKWSQSIKYQNAASHVAPMPSSADTSAPGRKGFLDLPAELRNDIYRMVFVKDSPRLKFYIPDFSRSAALLRTCRTIAEEGASILYSECDFFFRRNSTPRCPLWVKDGREVGFEDAHRFLKQIGPTNIARIRHVFFLLEDAVPCLNPHLKTNEERRYVHDKHLKATFRLLADYGQLQTLKLGFFGRRAINEADSNFLDEIKAVRADIVEVLARPCHPDWPPLYSNLQWPKIMFKLAVEVKKASTRKKKFYPPGERNRARGEQQDLTLCAECGQIHA